MAKTTGPISDIYIDDSYFFKTSSCTAQRRQSACPLCTEQQHLLLQNCHHILQFTCRTAAAVQPVPPQLSVAFLCFPSCFVLLLEEEVCAGLISITVSSFPITPQTPAGCLFTFRNKKWACAREDVPLIRGESPPPSAPPPNPLSRLHISDPPPLPPISVPVLIPFLIRPLSSNCFPPTPLPQPPTHPPHPPTQLSSCQITSNKTGQWSLSARSQLCLCVLNGRACLNVQ